MTRHLEGVVVPQAARFGVRVDSVGVKDVVLSGEMKALLNRVIEAEKEEGRELRCGGRGSSARLCHFY